MKARVSFDGASRGNPGPAGYGFVIELDTGDVICGYGYLGETTNNVAEYRGLIKALECAKALGVEEVHIISDSQLVVNQLKGLYKVKAPHLKELNHRAKSLLQSFRKADILFVEREKNREADRLANKGIERGWGGSGGRRPFWPEESPGSTGQGAG